MDRLTHYARQKSCHVMDLNVIRNEDIFIEIYSIPLPVPYLFCHHELQLSALLIPDTARARTNPLDVELGRLLERIPDGGAK